jgi:WD40 repeat protein
VVIQGTHRLRAAGEVSVIAFSPNGRWLVAGDKSSSLRIWDLSDGALMADLPGAGGWKSHPTSVAISADQRWLVSGHQDSVLRVRQLDSQKVLFEGPIAANNSIKAVAICPDGSCVAAGTRAGEIFILPLTA